MGRQERTPELKAEQEEVARLLSQVDVLEGLSDEDIAWLNQRSPLVRYEQGQFCYMPGHTLKTLFFLLEGQSRLYTIVDTSEITFDLIEAGSMFGEASLVKRPQWAYAQAMVPSRIVLVRVDLFKGLVQTRPEVGMRGMEMFIERLCHHESAMVSLGLKEVPARLANLLLHLLEREGVTTSGEGYRIPTRYTHEMLGTMIGAKRVAVTRAMRRLWEVGSVEIKRRHIHVTDRGTLKCIAKLG